VHSASLADRPVLFETACPTATLIGQAWRSPFVALLAEAAAGLLELQTAARVA